MSWVRRVGVLVELQLRTCENPGGSGFGSVFSLAFCGCSGSVVESNSISLHADFTQHCLKL